MADVTYSSAGTFTWTCPAGVTFVTIKVWGGGGGGGAAGVDHGSSIWGQPVSGGGGGGGGGAYAEYSFVSVPGRSYAVTIGAGGAGSDDPCNFDSDNDIFDGGNVMGADGGDTTLTDNVTGHLMAAAEGGHGAEDFFGLGGGGGWGDYGYDRGVTIYGTLVESLDGDPGFTAGDYLGGDGGSSPNGGFGGSGDPSGGFGDWGGDAGSAPGAGGGGANGVPEGDIQYYGPESEGYSTLTAQGGNGAPGRMEITYSTAPASSINTRPNLLMF